MEYTISYTTEGKNLQKLKNERRYIDNTIYGIIKYMTSKCEGYKNNPVYEQLCELHDLIDAAVKRKEDELGIPHSR